MVELAGFCCCDWLCGSFLPLCVALVSWRLRPRPPGVYGDVMRVKILFNKKENALIQMSDGTQAQLGNRRRRFLSFLLICNVLSSCFFALASFTLHCFGSPYLVGLHSANSTHYVFHHLLLHLCCCSLKITRYVTLNQRRDIHSLSVIATSH